MVKDTSRSTGWPSIAEGNVVKDDVAVRGVRHGVGQVLLLPGVAGYSPPGPWTRPALLMSDSTRPSERTGQDRASL